jgi:hypothetical protein
MVKLVHWVCLLLAWVWAGDATTCKSVGTGYIIECPCHMDFRFGREPGTSINCKGLGIKYFPSAFPANTTVLDLSDNEIRLIYEHHTTNYQMLEVLVLSNNQLESFIDTAVHLHENLTVLYLDNNPSLMEIPYMPESLLDLDIGNTGYVLAHQADLDLSPYKNFQTPSTLEVLTIKNSGLTKYPTSMPQELKRLRMSNNSLTEIGGVAELDYLEELILDENMITKLEGDPDIPPTIKILSLQLNQIERIESKYFHMFAAMNDLSINNNILNYISPQAFQGLDVNVGEDGDIFLEFLNNPYLKEVYEETFDPFLYSVQTYNELTVDLSGSGLNCECDMSWIPTVLAKAAKNSPYSPQQVYIRGTCHSPAALAGRQLSSLTVDEITCPPTTLTPPTPGGDDDSNAAAIVLGLLLAFSIVGIIGFFLYTKLYLGAKAANTYENIPEGGDTNPKSVNMAGLKAQEPGYQE